MSIQSWFAKALTQIDLSKIKLIISDVDGCLTNNSALFGLETNLSTGTAPKSFNISDGMGVKLAQESGLLVSLISGSVATSWATHERAAQLGIPKDLVHTVKSDQKVPVAQEIQARYEIDPEETIIFGDDVQDLALRKISKFFVSPQDGIFYVTKQADLIIPKNGGAGALRLLIDLILYQQEKHPYQEYITDALKDIRPAS